MRVRDNIMAATATEHELTDAEMETILSRERQLLPADCRRPLDGPCQAATGPWISLGVTVDDEELRELQALRARIGNNELTCSPHSLRQLDAVIAQGDTRGENAKRRGLHTGLSVAAGTAFLGITAAAATWNPVPLILVPLALPVGALSAGYAALKGWFED